MVNILPIASGKGGVGKSAIAVNLSILLAQKGKKVVLMDFDLGGANLHTLLGLKNNHAGLGNFIYKQESSLEPLMQPTNVPNLTFIAGDCLFPGTANMGYFIKRKLIKEIESLDADYAVLDLGGGTTYNTLDIYLLTYNSLLVTSPELTSVLNAYSFLKAAAYRFLSRQFKAKSPERALIENYIKSSQAGAESSYVALVDEICAQFPESGQRARSELAKYRPQVILNMGKSSQDLEMAKRLRSLVWNKLNIALDFVGFTPRDNSIELAVATRVPVALSSPQNPFIKQLNAAAERIMLHTYQYNENLEDTEVIPPGTNGNEASETSDIEELNTEFSSLQ
ncbi:P-loop NTPase [Treponema sp.]|uniref:P-loop NTPase n=1 Tax=Treponema sp. TaxID=166 RepID=UPI00298E5B4C|nr:P-loop NTPase [Treponema sp.]MCR5613786.1 P-loop NTPase [Treponema sp.]